jgi:hypothetical protein
MIGVLGINPDSVVVQIIIGQTLSLICTLFVILKFDLVLLKKELSLNVILKFDLVLLQNESS